MTNTLLSNQRWWIAYKEWQDGEWIEVDKHTDAPHCVSAIKFTDGSTYDESGYTSATGRKHPSPLNRTGALKDG